MFDVIIVGAGVSGTFAAMYLKKLNPQISICLIDGQKAMKKLLATGNGRCNLSNKDLDIRHYESDDLEKVKQAIDIFDIQKELKEFGLYTKYMNNLLYPLSEQAKTVHHIFYDYLLKNHVCLKENEKIINIYKKDYFIVETENKTYQASKLILSLGTNAGHLSMDTDRMMLLQHFDLKWKKFTPSLTQMKLKQPLPLKGVKVKAHVTLKCGFKSYQEKGEVLFTDYGISGICVMILSRYFEKDAKLSLDMFPEYSEKELDDILKNSPLDNPLLGLMNDKLANYLKQKKHINAYVLKHYELEIQDLREEKYAQVLKGGILLQQLSESFESYSYPGMYILGELLNVTGDCGGYNIHFALSSAKKASQEIERSLYA